MRVGIIGAGGIAKHHVDALESLASTSVTGVTDITRERAQWLIDATGAAYFDSVAALADHVDLAYVLTPPRARVKAISILAGKGLPLFCEKPLAASVTDAERIAAVVSDAGIPFMMGFMRRWHPPYEKLRSVIASGSLGQPILFHRTRVGHLELDAGNWRTDPRQLCGVTTESASHDLDLLRWLGGDLVTMRGEAIQSRKELPGFDESLVATGRFASGAAAALQVSWRSRISRNEVGVIGTEGAALITGDSLWSSDELRVETAAESYRVRFSDEEANNDGYRAQAAVFLDLASGKTVDHAGLADGLATLRLSQQILDSVGRYQPKAADRRNLMNMAATSARPWVGEVLW